MHVYALVTANTNHVSSTPTMCLQHQPCVFNTNHVSSESMHVYVHVHVHEYVHVYVHVYVYVYVYVCVCVCAWVCLYICVYVYVCVCVCVWDLYEYVCALLTAIIDSQCLVSAYGVVAVIRID